MMIFNDGRTAQGEDLPKISQRIAGALAELVSLHEQQIGGKPVQTVNGRELHQFLEIGRDYSNWMKDRIAEYDFIEGLDFIRVRKFDSPILANQRQRGGDRRSVEYFLSLGMAKELSMVERNEQGRMARRYFIDCERRLASVAPEQLAIAQAHWQVSRGASKDYHRIMCEALRQARAAVGKETLPHHYANELTMLNRLLLGMDGKAWLAGQGLSGEVRQHLGTYQLALLAYLERSNAALLDAGMTFAERKGRLAVMLAARIQREAKA